MRLNQELLDAINKLLAHLREKHYSGTPLVVDEIIGDVASAHQSEYLRNLVNTIDTLISVDDEDDESEQSGQKGDPLEGLKTVILKRLPPEFTHAEVDFSRHVEPFADSVWMKVKARSLKLPPHTCGLTLQHNKHKDYYQSIIDYIDENGRFNWPSEAEKQKAIDVDELWTIQWYPETPIGFNAAAAATLESLLEFVNSDK